MRFPFGSIVFGLLVLVGCASEPAVQTLLPLELYTVCLSGPQASETGELNPFTDVRLSLKLAGPDGLAREVPGYFAADGNAAETSAEAGDQWCVRLREAAVGDYTAAVRFERGPQLALKPVSTRGTALAAHDSTFGFRVSGTTEADGFLRYTGSGYPSFSESGKVFLKSGTNSPENFLAFADFDGTYSSDTGRMYVKTYETHLGDWQAGDTEWREGRGHGIVGALNYLAGQGVNGIYCVTNNIGGDARDVWMYTDHETFDRFDVSKLEQWDLVFRHANRLGINVQVVTQEAENETLLDGGDTGPLRQLYYRELVARFGHNPMVVWNLGEENGHTPWNEDPFQTDEQRAAMAAWFEANDPYAHPVVIHTLPTPEWKPGVLNPLLGNAALDGLSLQIHESGAVHEEVLRWRHRSDSVGRPWMMAMDEIGPWYSGSLSDAADVDHDTLRKEVLWGAFMAGAYGVEWYYGWFSDQSDLNAEDFRAREGLWQQTRVAREWMEELPLDKLAPADGLVSGDGNLAMATPSRDVVIAYLPGGGTTKIKLSEAAGRRFRLTWMRAKTGERIDGGEEDATGEMLLQPPMDGADWAVRLDRT